jgi:hypothetical protein
MKTGIYAMVLLAGVALTPTDTAAQQSTVAGRGTTEEAVSALRSLAIRISQCQEPFVSEDKWGRGPLEVQRFYIGTPKNVRSRSERVEGLSYMVGYIEFSSSFYWRVPLETAEKYKRNRHVVLARDVVTGNGVPFVPSFDGSQPPDTEYRYEFDLRSDGPQLVNVLSRSSPTAAWQAGPGHACAPRLEEPAR